MEPYEEWARQNLNVVKENTNNEWHVHCPSPSHEDNKPSAYFNVRKGVGLCQSCQYKFSAKSDEVNDVGLQIKSIRSRLKIMEDDKEEEVIRAPESTLARYAIPHRYWTDPIPEGRGLAQEMIDLFELGYDTMTNAVTIPERSYQGDLYGVTRRFLDDDHVGDRYKYAYGFKKANNLFGAWMFEEYDMSTVVMFEGAIDAIKTWQVGMPAVALYGSSPTEKQVEILHKIGVERIIFFGDGDEQGVRVKQRCTGYWPQIDGSFIYKEETDMTRDFIFYHVPNHYGKKDAGSMPDDLVRKCLNETELFKFRPKITYKPTINIRRRLLQTKAAQDRVQ